MRVRHKLQRAESVPLDGAADGAVQAGKPFALKYQGGGVLRVLLTGPYEGNSRPSVCVVSALRGY